MLYGGLPHGTNPAKEAKTEATSSFNKYIDELVVLLQALMEIVAK